MNDDQTHSLHVLKPVFSWLVVSLSGLTVIGVVNIFVGLLSSCWLACGGALGDCLPDWDMGAIP